MDENTFWQDLEIDPVSRMQLAEVIFCYAQASRPIIPSLLGALNDPSESVRGRAAQAFGQLNYLSEPVVTALLTKLERDPSVFLRACAIESLGKLQYPADGVILALVEALKDSEQYIREYATKALGSLQHSSSPVTLVLVDALKNEHPDVRAGVAKALGYTRHPSQPVMSALFEASKDELWSVRASALEALAHAVPASELCEAGILDIASDGRIDILKTIESRVAQHEDLLYDNLILAGRLLAYIPCEKTVDSEQIISKLRDLAIHGTPRLLRLRALIALKEIDSRALVDFLVQKTSESDRNVREQVNLELKLFLHMRGFPFHRTLAMYSHGDIVRVPNILLQYNVSHPNSGIAYLLEPVCRILRRVLPANKTGQTSELEIWREFLLNQNPEPLVKMLLGALSYRRLLGNDTRVRADAALALGYMGIWDERVVQSLVRILRTDRDSSVCGNAALALGMLLRPSKPVFGVLLDALDRELYARPGIAMALIRLGHVSRELINVLLEEFEHDFGVDMGDSRRLRAYRLEHVGWALESLAPPYAEEAVARLIKLFQNVSLYSEKGTLALTLASWGQKSDKVMGMLVDASLDGSQYASWPFRSLMASKIRAGAIYALGLAGQFSEEIIAAPVSALKDKDEEVRMRAAEALGRLGYMSPLVIDGLLVALGDEETDVVEKAAWALGELGQPSEEVVNSLLGAIEKHPRRGLVSMYALEALGSFTYAPPSLIAGLQKILRNSPDVPNRFRAAEGLKKLGQVTDTVITVFLQTLGHEGFQDHAFAALWDISRKSGRRFTANDLSRATSDLPQKAIETAGHSQRNCLILILAIVAMVVAFCILCSVLKALLAIVVR